MPRMKTRLRLMRLIVFVISINYKISKYDFETLKNDKKALEELNKKAILLESTVQMLQKQN